jgi:hypothetical protein
MEWNAQEIFYYKQNAKSGTIVGAYKPPLAFMNRCNMSFIALAIMLLISFSQQTLDAAEENPSSKQTLILVPLLSSATLDGGDARIPFSVKNGYSKAVSISYIVDLKTSSESGKAVSPMQYRTGSSMGSGLPSAPVILQPGQTGTFNSFCSMETLSFLKSKNKKVFGETSGRSVDTKESFGPCFSEPFSIPNSLTQVPWNNLGMQNYFTVTPDTSNISINPHKLDQGVWSRGWVDVPITIKNTSGQPLIALEGVSLSGVPVKEKSLPRYWAAIKVTKPLLMSGESISTNCETDLDALEGYKPGDKAVAVVQGRVPNTNQVFECYSAPFELPPLPTDKQPKGAVQIPGM